jgi:hypothetical protein
LVTTVGHYLGDPVRARPQVFQLVGWARKQARHTIVLGERGFNGFHKCIGGIFALRL